MSQEKARSGQEKQKPDYLQETRKLQRLVCHHNAQYAFALQQTIQQQKAYVEGLFP